MRALPLVVFTSVLLSCRGEISTEDKVENELPTTETDPSVLGDTDTNVGDGSDTAPADTDGDGSDSPPDGTDDDSDTPLPGDTDEPLPGDTGGWGPPDSGWNSPGDTSFGPGDTGFGPGDSGTP